LRSTNLEAPHCTILSSLLLLLFLGPNIFLITLFWNTVFVQQKTKFYASSSTTTTTTTTTSGKV
jgi:hypothetical protein